MTYTTFHEDILAGIPAVLPQPKPYDTTVSHAPKRKEILSAEEKVLAIKNALRYFPQEHHAELADEFAEELKGIVANPRTLEGLNFNFLGINLGLQPNWKIWTWKEWNWIAIGGVILVVVVLAVVLVNRNK